MSNTDARTALTIRVPTELLERADAVAYALYQSRTATVTAALLRYVEAEEARLRRTRDE